MVATITGTPVLDTIANLGSPFDYTVDIGQNRRLTLFYAASNDGAGVDGHTGVIADDITTDPTLAGVSHSNRGMEIGAAGGGRFIVTAWWDWNEAKLREAKCPVGDAVARALTAPVWLSTLDALEGGVMGVAVRKDVAQETPVIWVNGGPSDPDIVVREQTNAAINMPAFAPLIEYNGDPISEEYPLMFLVDASTSQTITGADGFADIATAVVDGSFLKAFLLGQAAGDAFGTTFNLTLGQSSPTYRVAWLHMYESHQAPAQASAGASALTLGKRPTTRSIDAKTIADAYNRGQPLKPDYTWPGGRKFYQDPPDTP